MIKKPNYSVNSFDLWDTLITRLTITPSDLFDYLEFKSGVNGFKNNRIIAEKKLFNTEFYTIFDIYSLLPYDIKLRKELLLMELSLEKHLTIPITEMVTAFSKTDIIISDMYIPGKYLTKIIGNKIANFNDSNNLYVSCDLLMSKHNGNIFPFIKDKFNINIHIGDHLVSDFKMPYKYGIKSKLFNDVTLNETEKHILKVSKGQVSELVSLMRGVRLSTSISIISKSNSSLINFYRYNFTPFLFLYIKWILAECLKNSIDKIFFLSRDGYLPYIISHESNLFKEQGIDIEYLEVSRKVLNEIIQDNGISGRSYLDEKGFFKKSKDKIAIVDIGWHGSLQELLNEIRINNDCDPIAVGFYVGISEKFKIKKFQEASAFLYDGRKNKRMNYWLMNFIPVMENLMMCPNGTVIGYEKINFNSKPIYGIQSQLSKENYSLIEIELKLFIDYYLRFKKHTNIDVFEKQNEFIKFYFTNQIKNTMYLPNKSFALNFLNHVHDENHFDLSKTEIVKNTSLKSILMKSNSIQDNGFWKEGSIVLIDTPLSLIYLHVRYLYRRLINSLNN